MGPTAIRWSKAIRSIQLEDADRLFVEGPDRHPVNRATAAQFAPVPIHAPNTVHERRFIALMLLIAGELRPYRNERRACGVGLWRGRQHKHVITAEGELERVYVPAESAGGLASRLGCSVRTIDRYLRIARAARLIDVWQIDAKKAKPGQAGKIYGYAVFRWLLELPTTVLRRLNGRPARAEAPAPKQVAAAAPAAEQGAWTSADETLVGGLLERLKGRPRAPT